MGTHRSDVGHPAFEARQISNMLAMGEYFALAHLTAQVAFEFQTCGRLVTVQNSVLHGTYPLVGPLQLAL